MTAFLLRAGCAVVTESDPVFPSYYYNDARYADQHGRRLAAGDRSFIGSTAQRANALFVACIYKLAGPRPLAAKLVKAALASAGIVLLYAGAVPVFGTGPALAAAALTTVWPSHVFFTSQNFLDPLVFFGTAAGLLFLLRSRAPAAGAAIGFVGLFRPVTMLLLAASSAALARPILLAAALLGVAGQRAANQALVHLLPAPKIYANDVTNETRLIPRAWGPDHRLVSPVSPAGIAEFRRRRQALDRAGAGRPISTQLFPDLELRSWLDVALFVPRGAFHAVLMPLPGLYPLDGKLGRVLASAENVILLALLVLAAAGAVRGPLTRERGLILAFVLLNVGLQALLEYDLGSAARHKSTYLPFLFPFILSAGRPRPGSKGVMQVVECGGPGGTGNQVAFLCRELGSTLVYNVREGRAEDYSACAPRAVRVPELTRELSPFRDLRAFWKLYRLFRAEQPAVVHAHSSKAGALARPAAWLAGVPKIFYSPHGYGFLQRDRSAASRALYRAAEWALSWIGTIVAVSPGEADLARPLAWGRPIETVPDAFLGEAGEPLKHDGLVVGACGRLTAARNPPAFARLAAAVPEARFVWIGDGPERPAGLEVSGWLDAAAVRERLRGLDVLVHYSAWDALPNAVLEAMAVGVPVVASEAARDALGEAGLYARDEAELLRQVRVLLGDPALRARLSAAGRERVEALFSRKAALDRLRALYT